VARRLATQEEQETLFKIIPSEKFDQLTREELVILAKGGQDLVDQLKRENARLRAINEELKQRTFILNEQIITVKNRLFGKSSERSKTAKVDTQNISEIPKKKRVLLPSERYPDAPLIERHIVIENPPSCKCCGSEMKDSGMTEDSEYLTKVPAQYYVVLQMRHK
jgi:hypothetical protein